MAFTPQDNDATVDGANSYVGVAAVRAYWLDRGIDLAQYTDAQVQSAAVKATDYLDARHRWVGYQLRRLQGTQWPRGGVSSFLRGIPPALANATCALAQRALAGKTLLPDPTVDASGQRVLEKTTKVGPIETQLKYSGALPVGSAETVPQFPEVTLALKAAGLVGSFNSGEIGRG